MKEALELTTGGIGAAFFVLVLLVLVVLLTKWGLETQFVQKLTGDSPELAASRRAKATASAIAISVALAEAREESPRDTRDQSSE